MQLGIANDKSKIRKGKKQCNFLFTQAKNSHEQGMVEFDLSQILFIMQTGHFELIYKLLFREATRDKKRQFDINMFHAALILFLNYI